MILPPKSENEAARSVSAPGGTVEIDRAQRTPSLRVERLDSAEQAESAMYLQADEG